MLSQIISICAFPVPGRAFFLIKLLLLMQIRRCNATAPPPLLNRKTQQKHARIHRCLKCLCFDLLFSLGEQWVGYEGQ